MKKILIPILLALGAMLFLIPEVHSQQNQYVQRFLTLRDKIQNPTNGYFSPDGVPYHSVETLICEAPDYGHETTSETYSYWIWLESMYGILEGDWAPLNNAWTKMETYAIPTSDLQPTAGSYNPSSPATYAAEHPLPSDYPSALESNVPVGQDPVSAELTSTYGNSYVYGMHWLFDCDNFYGFGNKGDGVSTPSYINTFQRGPQESVWETVPQPCWEDFSWGSDDGTGYLKLFIDDPNPAKQWKYTDAPDADARAIQAIYWAYEAALSQGLNPSSVIPVEKAKKMGDYLRLAMFDKYFRPMGVQDKTSPGGTGYESAHYLLSWYYAWGGPLTNQGWAWRIGCSHNHFGYQNPLTAYALSSVSGMIPNSPNAGRDWATSLSRQLEFYQWLQSSEGAIAGGATNSWNGDYQAYPAGTATFYGMAYVANPVYLDPGSNTWFGFQAWSVERVAEYYYVTGDSRAKAILDNWVPWAKSEVHLLSDGTFEIPSTLSWSGQPNTWDPANPTPNTNLHVTVVDYGKDLGIAACLAKAFTYYAAATQKYGTLDTDTRDLAKEILDREWNNYYEPNGKGVAVAETRSDYHRFFDQTVYIPSGWTGHMPNGDVIQPGITFLDIRSKYRSDPDFATLQADYNSGVDYTATYHRFWAQVDIALANAEYGILFGDTTTTNVAVTGVTVAPTSASVAVGGTTTLTAAVSPVNATNKAVSWSSDNTNIATVNSSGVVTGVATGSATITATTADGGFTASSAISVSNSSVPVSGVTVAPTSASVDVGSTTTLTATVSPSNATDQSVSWSSDNTSIATVSSSGVVTGVTSGSATITVTTTDGGYTAGSAITVNGGNPTPCANPTSISLPFTQDGSGDNCYVTSGTISYVNSWNMQTVEINGVDFTNVWSNSMPARINGNYYIHYVANVGWAHLEVNGTGGGTGNIAVTGVSVAPTSASVNVGGTTSLTATVSPSDATDQSVSWSSSNTSIATVSSSGVVTGVAAGSATITATTTDGSFTASSTITVNSTTVPVTGVTVAPTSATVNVGGTTTLTATVSPSNATNKSVSWSSSNTNVATVNSSGVVTGAAVGTATITVTTTDGGFTAASTITVNTTTISVTGVTVTPTSASVAVGGTTTLTATVSPSNATDKSVSWSSDNTSIATVSSSGVVTGVANGTATITVTTTDGGFTATSTITVTVSNPVPCSNPVTITIPFSQDGAGEYCWVTSQSIAYINSWNMDLLEVNGVDFTNVWSNNLPAPINGNYYIHYVGSVAWAHFEAPATKGAGSFTDYMGQGVKVYPVPFKDALYIDLNGLKGVQGIELYNTLGQLITSVNADQISGQIVKLDVNNSGRMFILRIKSEDGTIVKSVVKQ